MSITAAVSADCVASPKTRPLRPGGLLIYDEIGCETRNRLSRLLFRIIIYFIVPDDIH